MEDRNQVAVVESKMDYHVDKLTSDNYVIWKCQILNIFRAKRLHEALESSNIVAGQTEQQAMALLGSALNEENKMFVIGCGTAHQVWARLESIYENKTSFEKQDLLIKLHAYKIGSMADIARSLAEIQTLASKLNLLGEHVSDDSLMSIIMRALPSSFDSFLVAFKLLLTYI